MKDLIRLVEYFIYESNLPKNIDCSYGNNNSLLDIAYIINDLSEHKVEINVRKATWGKDYIGNWNPLNIKWKGLEQGIKETYKKLLNGKN